MSELEVKAREAAERHASTVENVSPPFSEIDRETCAEDYVFGYLAGHASRDAEIAAKDEDLAAMQAKLVQQAHDYRAQVVFWGDNADTRSAEIASLRAKLAEAEAKEIIELFLANGLEPWIARRAEAFLAAEPGGKGEG